MHTDRLRSIDTSQLRTIFESSRPKAIVDGLMKRPDSGSTIGWTLCGTVMPKKLSADCHRIGCGGCWTSFGRGVSPYCHEKSDTSCDVVGCSSKDRRYSVVNCVISHGSISGNVVGLALARRISSPCECRCGSLNLNASISKPLRCSCSIVSHTSLLSGTFRWRSLRALSNEICCSSRDAM
jgi:hypothetical protein